MHSLVYKRLSVKNIEVKKIYIISSDIPSNYLWSSDERSVKESL